MAFVELGTSGRLPVLAPLEWDEEGWPNVVLDENGDWKGSYYYPLPRRNIGAAEGKINFSGSNLPTRFEWNHNPDNDKWSVGAGLKLHTATVTDDFFVARNTLTHRIVGPEANATVELDYSAMKDGDYAGLASMRYDAGWIGVVRKGCQTTVQMVDYIEMEKVDSEWQTAKLGETIASAPVVGGKIWLRCHVTTKSPNISTFMYSTDGETFVELGQVHETIDVIQWFTGTRHGIFNFATKELGGSVLVNSFEISQG